MIASFTQTMIGLLAGIVIIILLTTKFKVHAFFALMFACFVTGLILQMPVDSIISTMKDGFGNIMKSLGFIIVLGTTLGVLLEHTGSTKAMAGFILKKVGEKKAALAMSLTGFIVGLPVFCDSGYIVLNGLNKSLIRKTRIPTVVMSVSLATGLASVHCLIPPHPGAAAAASTIGADIGALILYGIIVAIPAMLAAHWWAATKGKEFTYLSDEELIIEEDATAHPSPFQAFLPVILPVILIASRSFLIGGTNVNFITQIITTSGEPVIALSVGILLALNCKRGWKMPVLGLLSSESVEKAGSILVIIAAGGAFGAILTAAKLGDHLSGITALQSMGILFPFLITSILKTAQGSSTVAIITAASIVQPFLSPLGLESETGKIICVLSMGAGSMMISHANDAFFWVISKFSGIPMNAMLKVYTTAMVIMALVSLFVIYILSLFIL
ncbi:MAG TPA: GntP family permease [Panacibacter sp.]|nr:GntP family permease [Panacibacter sp.]HNP44254.1 GntP family permease [Panacibacter sp.]